MAAVSTTAARLDQTDVQRARETDVRGVWARLGLPELPTDGGNISSPFRADPGPSVQVGGDKNVVHDYGIGETLDSIALVRKVMACTFWQAVQWILGSQSTPPARREKRPKLATITPVPANAPAPMSANFRHGEPSSFWDYLDAQGRLLNRVCRFDLPSGGKEVIPQSFCVVPGGVPAWRWQALSEPRPLCGLDRLAAQPDAPVLWVEGEKTRDAAERKFQDHVALASPGGGKAVSKVDYGPLKGRRVAIWGDADSEGRDAAQKVARLAHETGASEVRLVAVPAEFERVKKGWDLADAPPAGWDAARLRGLLESAPVWTPTAATATATSTDAPANFDGAGRDAIRSTLWKIAQNVKLGATEKYREQAAAVVAWLHARGRFYFHVELRNFASVMLFDSDRKILLLVQSDGFLAWLADALAMNRAERSFAFVQAAVETEGLSERSEGIEPAIFWARRGDKFYLSNGPGRMARISAAGVVMLDNGTDGVLFPYGATLPAWALVEPVDPFEKCSVFRDMSTTALHGKLLFKLWAMSLPTDPRTKPQLVNSGPVGSGKTRGVVGLFDLFGIPAKVANILKNGEKDFWTAMDAGGLVCFDNADTRIEWLPDALAAAATGGTQEKRALYTNKENVSLKARAWVAVTSASPTFASDPGLADRLIVVRLNRRAGETAESALTDEVLAHRDAGLSFICHALANALADTTPTPNGLSGRHPDFAAMAVRIGRALGQGDDAVAALRAAEADKSLFNLENDSIGSALLDLLQNGPWRGTAAELLANLREADGGLDANMTAKRLGKRLAKLWPHLESVFGAKSEKGHHSITQYFFSGGFGGFQSPKTQNYQNIPYERDFTVLAPSNPPNPPNEGGMVDGKIF